MAKLKLDHVTIEFPLLHEGHRSLKKAFVNRSTGGRILKDAEAPSVVRALSDVSLELQPGDRVGLIGPNGAGKTTLLRAMAGIYEPMSGSVEIEGKVATLFDISAGMSPGMTGWENIELRGLFMGLTRREVADLADEVEEFCGLGDFLNMPVRSYSSGMHLRLAFAVATSIKADILLMDEWVLAGDAAFTTKASERLEKMVTGAKILVLASHNEHIISQWCNKAAFLQSGEVKFFGEVNAAIEHYHSFF
ncbi:ABC transporter ATP-binding protein [Hoeflea sp.]|uniref:ABC transporter ATP-binding protein n=1 Tax=Hoeflea sp. TaxID=1940281 RepID=UPI003B516103